MVSLGSLTLLLSSVVTLVCFVPPNAPGPLGRLSFLFGRTLPSLLSHCSRAVGLTWVLNYVGSWLYWFAFKKHYVIFVAYLCLIVGVYGVYVVHAYPLLPNSHLTHPIHKWIGAALFVACLGSFLLAAFSDPGVIRRENVAEALAAYPYDEAIFPARAKPDGPPRVCDIDACGGLPKVARSKHSRATGQCVARFDHYCIWLANDVGARNYRYFLSFLVFNSAIMYYGCVASYAVAAQTIDDNNLWEARFVNRVTGEKIAASYYILFQYLLSVHGEIVMGFMICAVMGVVLTGFSIYHFYLAAYNVTTNESVKWGDLRSERAGYIEHVRANLRRQGASQAEIDDVEKKEKMPANKYDKGACANLWEVFCPPLRAVASARAAAAKEIVAPEAAAPAAVAQEPKAPVDLTAAPKALRERGGGKGGEAKDDSVAAGVR